MSELNDHWVNPFYRELTNFNYATQKDPAFTARARCARDEVSPAIVTELISHANWRHNLVGAWLAGIKGWREFQEPVGELLITPGLPMRYRLSGFTYCLASFASDKSAAYLENYLRSSLKAGLSEGWALGALLWVDKICETRFGAPFVGPGGLWERSMRDHGLPASSGGGLVWRDRMRNVMTYTSLICGTPLRGNDAKLEESRLSESHSQSIGRFPMLAISHRRHRRR